MATYVLVHGAYQGGWIWKPVADRLRAAKGAQLSYQVASRSKGVTARTGAAPATTS